MKIIYSGIECENYNPQRCPSFEYSNFYLTLKAMPGVSVIEYPFGQILHKGKERFNADLLDLVRREKPDLFFAFMYTDEFEPATLDAIKKLTTSVAWFADDHWRLDNYSRFFAPHFTHIITTWSHAPAQYRAHGASNVLRSQWACSTRVWKPIECERDIDVSFVGQYNSARADIINRLRRSGVNVYVRGWGWPEGRLSQEDMIRSFSRSKVNLNFNTPPERWRLKLLARLLFRRSVKQVVPDVFRLADNVRSWQNMSIPQIKARPFEILGCRTFLISGFADDMNHYYQHQKEIVYYDGTVTDLVSKIQYYLNRPEERERIAQAGYERTVREHTYEKRFKDIFKTTGLFYEA